MRGLVLVAALAIALPALADEPRREPDVDVVVPVEPREHERLHYFGQRWHHLVPGTVTINGAAYVCDVDKHRFNDRDRFVIHLRVAHHVPPEDIPDHLVVVEGRVHFIAE